MSLSAHDRHELDLIEEALAGADPRFAANLSAFSRLADGEAMPERERIRAQRQHAAGRAWAGARRGHRGMRTGGGWITIAAWLLISLALVSAALAFGHPGSTAECAQWQGLVCVRHAVPRHGTTTGRQ